MKKMILAFLLLSCAAFGATGNSSESKVTPGVSNIATYNTPQPGSRTLHVPVASDIPIPTPGGGWPPLY